MSWLQHIEENQSGLIQRLADAVAIPSVSGDAAHRADCVRMVDWTQKLLESLGVKVQRVPLGPQHGTSPQIDLPPVLLGELGSDPAKKTILLYGHLDVQPAAVSDGWNTEPFELVHDTKTDRLYGRGSTDVSGFCP